MKSIKNKLTPKPPTSQATDAQREKYLKLNRLTVIGASVYFIILGTQELMKLFLNISLPPVIGISVGLALPILFIATLLEARTLAKYELREEDEFETHENNASKARAFNLLSMGLFFIFLLNSVSIQPWFIPVLYILVGIAWLISIKTMSYYGKQKA